jgi:DNA repair photolyase
MTARYERRHGYRYNKTVPLPIHHAEAHGILSATCGFITEAGFTHSLSPAHHCTCGCTYCYVPTMQIYGGLKPADWQHWRGFTTFKANAPELLEKSLRADQIICCSPLVDPYQPAEVEEGLMDGMGEWLLPTSRHLGTLCAHVYK